MMDASIAIAASGRAWAPSLNRFVADHGGARVRLRVMHPEQALTENYDVLVIDDVTSFLTAHLVIQVQRRDRKVLGVFEEATGEERLRQLGVDGVIRADAEPELFIASIVDLAAHRTVDEEFAELIADLHNRPDPALSRGVLIGVGGAGGGVGATEVAIGLAADLARRGVRSCLVDAEDVAPHLSQRLGLSMHPNIRTAMDHLEQGNRFVGEALHQHGGGFMVLPGLSNPRDWIDIRSHRAADVITELMLTFDAVIANVSSMVEPIPAISRDGGRFGLSRRVLALADHVVLVGAPTPVGVRRMIEWLADTQRLVATGRLHVAVNRFQDSLFAKGEITREVHGVIQPASLTFLPADTRVERAAWEGRLAPQSGFSKALSAVAGRLQPVAAQASTTRQIS